jgi:hypothetical protein
MLPFLIYEGKVAVALAVFSLFYRLLLKRESFHRLNRRVLVGAMIVSFLLPLCVITIHKPMELASQQATVTTTTGNTPGAWWPTALSILYFACVAFVLARELVSILSVLRIIRQGEQVREQDGCKIIITNRDVGPFSWMRYIVLSRQDWASPHESIITHEKAHIQFRHSIDLLLIDILSAFQWFNPAIWVLRMDLQELHEYEADDAVLRSGANLKDYQYLLVKKAVGKSGYSVANSFNHSILKNRITMMTKTKSTLTRGLRVLWLIPLMCMCVGLQTKTVYDDLPIHPEGTVVLNLNEDGLVYINGSGYGVEIERVGRDLRGAIGNRVYPEVTIQVDASPDAPAGSAEQLRDELRKVGLLKINRMRHE